MISYHLQTTASLNKFAYPPEISRYPECLPNQVLSNDRPLMLDETFLVAGTRRETPIVGRRVGFGFGRAWLLPHPRPIVLILAFR